MNELFTEKYRPKTFDEIVGQKEIVEEIKKCIEKKELPHLLFSGPAGVGKTTLALVIARNLFGENFKSNFMELNASDERGIQVIREKVKEFAKIQPLGGSFKIIFLDEADALTNDAQASLRRIMELYSKTTRFILSCNYVNKIISPIQSRCMHYQFSKLTENDIQKHLLYILTILGLKIDVSEIVSRSKGDMRMALNELQAIVSLGVESKKLDGAEGNRVKEFYDAVSKRSFMDARGSISNMIKEGKDSRRLLVELRDYIIENKEDSKGEIFYPNYQSKILLELLKADVMLVDGVEEILVFDGLIINILK